MQSRSHLLQLVSALMTIALWLSLTTPQRARAQERERVAVMDLKVAQQKGSAAKVATDFEADTLTETLRASVSDLNLYMVMTKENIMELIEPGKRLEDCLGECEVQTGRNIGAHYIITGKLGKIDGRFDLFIKLHSVKSGEQISAKNVQGDSIDELRSQLKLTIQLMFSSVTMSAMGLRQGQASTLLYVTIEPPEAEAKLILDKTFISFSDQRVKRQGEGYLIPLVPEIKHKVTVSAEGYISSSDEFIVNDGNLNVRLAKKVQQSKECAQDDSACLAELFVYTTPSGATVYVDCEGCEGSRDILRTIFAKVVRR